MIGRERQSIRAVVAMNTDSAAFGDESDDFVAWHRRAAPRQTHQNIVHTFDMDATCTASTMVGDVDAVRDRQSFVTMVTAHRTRNALCESTRRDMVFSDGRKKCVEVAVIG